MIRRRKPRATLSHPSAGRYPTPEERERTIQRRDALLKELITLFVARPPAEHDAAIARLARTYGITEVQRVLEYFAKSTQQRVIVGEEPGLYRGYRLAFARFGGERRFLGKHELEELNFEYGMLVAKREFKSLLQRGPSKRERELRRLLLIDERAWDDLFPPSPPSRPPDYTAPPTGAYPAPLKELLNLGWRANEEAIAAMARDAERWKPLIPDLERMVLDAGLLSGWPAEPPSWAPLHALRLLGHLRAHQSAGRLTALMDREDDWLSDLLPSVWAEMGPQAAEPLWDYIADQQHAPDQRGNVMIGLQRLAEKHPGCRREVIEGLAEFLDHALVVDSTANAYAMLVLSELRAIEALPALNRAFEAGKVDLTVMTWGDMMSRMGWAEANADTLPPIGLPPEERLDALMQGGYALLEAHRVIAACDRWLEAWELVKQMATPEMRTVNDFDDAYPGGMQVVFNWCSDVDTELHNAGLDNPIYHEHRLRYAREFLAQFPDEDANRYVNFMRAQGEALWSLGRRAEAEAVYAELVERFPDEGWGYIGWADNYWLWGAPDPKEYHKAEAILQRALARPNLQDRADVLERLAELYGEWAKPEEQAGAEAEREQVLARSRSWRRFLPQSLAPTPPAPQVSPPGRKRKRKRRRKGKK